MVMKGNYYDSMGVPCRAQIPFRRTIGMHLQYTHQQGAAAAVEVLPVLFGPGRKSDVRKDEGDGLKPANL